jgi:hypothetical protein
MKGLGFILKTLKNEGLVALLTGVITFGLCMVLTQGATMAAADFALAAGLIAAGLDTIYFHLLYLLREAQMRAAERRYQREMEDARRRLMDGSIRLREALIRRFEEDYRRTVATHPQGGVRRQLREAKRRLKARLWTVQRVITGEQLVEATAEAKSDPELLERWTARVDALVDARIEVEHQWNVLSGALNRLQPARLARQSRETLAGWDGVSSKAE